MKKTFKRSIACLLAVLMVALSMPFTALAESPCVGPTPQGSNEMKVWWDPENPPTEEPKYVGYNSDELNDWWGDPDSTGGWNWEPGQAVNVSDTEGGVDDLQDEYRPLITAYVSDYSTYDAPIYGTADQRELKDCNMKDPTDLKQGDKIALSFEMGGFDTLMQAVVKFKFDTNYLEAAYWKNFKGKYTWTTCTSSGGTASNGVLSVAQDIGYPKVTTVSSNVDIEDGYVATTAQSNYAGDKLSVYIGGPEERMYGTNGIFLLTITLEVKQDCSLADVLTWEKGEGGSYCMPYHYDMLKVVRPEIENSNHTFRYMYGFDYGTPQGESGNMTIYGFMPPVNYYGTPTEEPTPGHTHEYGAPTYQWADDNSTCTATMTCPTCEEGTEGKTVTETVESQYTVVTPATCEAEGTGKYTATFTTNAAFVAQEKTVTIPVTEHTYGGTYAPVTDKTHAQVCTECGAVDAENAVACEFTREVTKAPTCVDKGVATYTCDVCGNSYTEEIPATEEHTPNYAAADYQWTGNDTDGYTACVAVVPCSVCGGEALRVEGTVEATPEGATCTTPGKTTYTATFADENLETQTKVVTGATLPHDYDYENVEYTWTDTTSCKAVATCKNCDATVEATTTNITSKVTVEPTCQTMGTTTYTATFDGDFGVATKEVQNVPTVEHDYSVLVSEKVDATVDAPGKEAVYKCKWCDATIGGEVIPQLAYYTVTATAENGEAKVEGVSPMNHVAVNGDITLTATPAAEDLEFVGWSLNDKIVSTDLVYTTKAIADAAYVAIFKEAETSSFTVVFTDQYGNVYSSQTVTDASEIVIPEAPVLVGYTFAGWSMTEEEIKALDSSATITANFERTADDMFTVTVPADCTIDGVDGNTTTVAYNTKVTVNAPEGAVNGTWKVNDAAVAYGTTYSFFVGSDITLTYEENAAVTAEPTVAAVSTDKDNDSYRVAFLATRSLADGYNYIYAGFVFGKNLEDADLDLNKVGEQGSNPDSGIVKALYCSTDSEQFRLNYGISSATGTASAKAFLAYVDGQGETHIMYAEPQVYNY